MMLSARHTSATAPAEEPISSALKIDDLKIEIGYALLPLVNAPDGSDRLTEQIKALRRQIAALEAALEASEKRDKESQTKITDLGSRLNVALAQRVQGEDFCAAILDVKISTAEPTTGATP